MKKITAIVAAIPGWHALFFGENQPDVVELVGWMLRVDEENPADVEVIPCEFSAGTWTEINVTLSFWKILGPDDPPSTEEEYQGAYAAYKAALAKK